MQGIYTVNHIAIAVTGAITIIQLKAGATRALELVEFSIGEHTTATAAMAVITCLRKTAAATVTSFTPLLYSGGEDTPPSTAVGGTAATGITASAEGTDGDILVSMPFDITKGLRWNFGATADRPLVPPAGIVALKFTQDPPDQTYTAQLKFREL